MLRPLPYGLSALAAICAIAVIAGGCAVPLGPGYSIQKQTLELRFLPSPQPRLTVHASYDLKNSGNQPLRSIRVLLPAESAFHRSATSAQWNKQLLEVTVISRASTADVGDALELRLPEPWAVKQNRSLVLDYELSTGSHLGAFLSASPESFFAYPDSWNPALLPPKHFFGSGGVPPKKWTLAIHVPAGYLAHAGGVGKRAGSRGEWTYSFEQGLRGFAPFAAAGKYVQTEANAEGQRVLFWTFEPVDTSAVQSAASSIAARARYYETEYGSPVKGDRTIRLLECVPPSAAFGCGALPRTILVHQNWVIRGLKDPGFLDDANFELAYTWFGGASRVRFDESPLPMDALAAYAGWEAQAVSEGSSARSARIRKLIADFDARVSECKAKVILPLPAGSDDCSYPAAWTKSGLFFFALEDEAGRTTLHSALKQMLDAREGRDFSLEDLMAAVDAESGKPQGMFVRTWLKHAGIPEEFRALYSGAVGAASDSEVNSAKEHQP